MGKPVPSLFIFILYKNGTWSFSGPMFSLQVVQTCTILHLYDTPKPLELQAFPSIFEARKIHL